METPNYMAMFVDAQEAGRKRAKERAVDNALATYATDPAASQDALLRAGALPEAAAVAKLGQLRQDQQLRTQIAPKIKSGDYTGAQQDAAAAGDFDMAKTLNGMHDDQLKQMEANTQKVAAIAHYLEGVKDPNQRQALWQQTAPHLVQQGILKQTDIPGIDISDKGLQGYQAQGMTLSQQIELEFKKRAEQMKVDDFKERVHHDRASEGTAAFSAQTGRLNYQARKAAGGFGTPGAGYIGDHPPPGVAVDPED